MDPRVAIIGGGPAGLMAAERLAELGVASVVYDGMPTVGRKFLLAGKSGLNLTHAEAFDRFVTRYAAGGEALRAALHAFTPDDLRAWAAGLGIETFVGTSGRVFPTAMKASPLLRAWLRRLVGSGVEIRTRHRWIGFAGGGRLVFDTPEGRVEIQPAATVLALGGASWPRLGSDGAWTTTLGEAGVPIHTLRPANCGFDVDWSQTFAERYAGQPIKSVVATAGGATIPGEFMVTRTGVEGSLVYAHAAPLRDALDRGDPAVLTLDLLPGRPLERVARELGRPRGKQSTSNHWRKALGLEGVKAGLLRELTDEATRADPSALARAIKALPLRMARPRPIAEAISTAGGVPFDALDAGFQLRALPGVFIAGEMLDWEAPTGGYLLTACFATGRAAADGVARRLQAMTPGLESKSQGLETPSEPTASSV